MRMPRCVYSAFVMRAVASDLLYSSLKHVARLRSTIRGGSFVELADALVCTSVRACKASAHAGARSFHYNELTVGI